MGSDINFQSLELLTLRRVSQYVDWMVGDHFDEGKKDLVKRLVKSYLPPIPTEYRHGLFWYRDFYIADWFGPEEDDGIRTIRLRQDSDLGRGDSFWVPCHLNGGVPGGCIRNFLDGSAADSAIARVKVVSKANPTRRIPKESQARRRNTTFRVEVDKIIPMEQLCLYFTATAFPLPHSVDFVGRVEDFDSVDVRNSHNNTVVRFDYFRHVDDLRLEAMRLYKQVDGTWYGNVACTIIRYDDWDDYDFWLRRFELLQENQVEEIVKKFQVDGRPTYDLFFNRLQNEALDEE